MDELEFIGGAEIGSAHVTYPLATLTVFGDRLELNASLFGNCSFAREDIISFVEITGIFSDGVQIRHRVPPYKEEAIFWTRENPTAIIDSIKESEFWLKRETDKEILFKIRERQAQGPHPLKRSVTIGAIILWNALFLIDVYRWYKHQINFPMDKGAAFDISLFLLFFITLLSSEKARKLLLKPGREVKDINKMSYLSILIFGALLIGIIAMPK
jgi:hypothetical protein